MTIDSLLLEVRIGVLATEGKMLNDAVSEAEWVRQPAYQIQATRGVFVASSAPVPNEIEQYEFANSYPSWIHIVEGCLR